MRFSIVIQQPSNTRDDEGGVIQSWSTFASVRADMDMLTGREAAFAQNFAATAQYKITARYVAGVLPTMRVSYTPPGGSAETYAINAVIDPDKLRITMLLYCTQVLTS
jgi:SPP1 family predicted phage head-tail adaptor